jgi:PAS domain S-box-containing protein
MNRKQTAAEAKTGRTVRDTLRRIIMLTTTCALVLACLAFAAADLLTARAKLEADLTTLASVIGSNSAAALMFGDRESAVVVLHALAARPSVVATCLYAEDGHIFATYAPRGARLACPASAPPVGAGLHGRRLEVAEPIRFDGKRIGTLFLAADLRDMAHQMRLYAEITPLILGAALLVALLVASRLQRIISNPLLELAAVAGRVRRDRDYSLRIGTPPGAPQEMQNLSAAFDDMLAEVERRDEELGRRRARLEEQVQARTAELQAANAELTDARDRAEFEAQRNERLGRHRQAILDAAGEGIFGLDEDGLATFINTSAARMLGHSVDQLVGRRLHLLIHPSDGEPVRADDCTVCSTTMQPSLRSGSNIVFAARDGRRIPVEYTASTMRGENGRVRGVVVTFRDITERQAVERMKDEFVSTVSHELRTPLTSIRGALGLLSSGLLGAVTDKAHRMLSIAVTNTDRLVRLINDILDLEKMSSGKVELNQRVTNAAEVVRDAVDVVRAVADRAGVTIRVGEMEDSLWVDRDRIVQTLTNLIGNAVKFSNPGSSVQLTGSRDGAFFRFSVQDRGRGIPPGKLDAIFERFQQVNATDSRDKGGTGLGLAISRSIIAAHGGRIWVESDEGRGSTFHFTVPLATQPGVSSSSTGTFRKIVMICDENAPDSQRVVSAVESYGYQPMVVDEIDDVVARAAAVEPAAIILNLSGPSADTLEALEPLQASPETAGIPLIVADREPRPLPGTVAAWIPLPFSEPHIAAALTAAVGRKPILIVEDDADLAGIVGEALRDHGFTSLWAASGDQAMTMMRSSPPALVILDLGLPGLDGFQIVEQMRASPPLALVPLVVYSASDLGAADEARLRLGPSRFLTKSRVPLSELVATVMRLMKSAEELLETTHGT